MKNRSGFTLVELITVIALLGVIMLLVVPNVVESFSNAKKNTFYNDLLSLYSVATSTYITNAADDQDTPKIFCNAGGSGDNPMNIDVSDKLKYRIEVDKNGQVIKLKASNSEFSFELNKSDMKKSDIKKKCASGSTQCIQEVETAITCD